MGQPETPPLPEQHAKDESLEKRTVHAVESGFRYTARAIGRWAKEHTWEIFWAVVFAFVVAWFLDPPKPDPFIIYIVADPRTEPETLQAFQKLEDTSRVEPRVMLGDVPVQVKLEKLDDPTEKAAIAKAEDLVKRPDTLMVIGHMPSPFIEASLSRYFLASPPVPFLATTASDEELLARCENCRTAGFTPLLQLSPTNKEQGLAAIRYATERDKRTFLIVTEKEDSYAQDLVQAYHAAIDEFNKQHPSSKSSIVGRYTLAQLQLANIKEEVQADNPDCVLYAGELEVARPLLRAFQNSPSMVILSDSTLESRLSDNALRDFTPVRFTYQTDASDYNSHSNVYGLDAYWIARQLIGDLNRTRGDFLYWLTSHLHLHPVKRARMSLVHVMAANASSRTWYRGAPDGDDPGTPYIFDGSRRVDAIFHVWQMKQGSAVPGSEMMDVDQWHVPKRTGPAAAETGQK